MLVSLLGVDFFSDNRGCAALGFSAVNDLKSICDKIGEKLEVFAVVFNMGAKKLEIEGVDCRLQKVEPKKLSYWKTCYSYFKRSDIVIDFTGGDSFSDIYGFKRFLIAILLKRLAIMSKATFILGPQTIGPFKGRISEAMAKNIMRKADYCFARDSFSRHYANELTRKEISLSMDVAFSLPSVESESVKTTHNIGINPSGLLWYGTSTFKTEKHLALDYRKYTYELIKYLTTQSDYNVYLIPHVFSSEGKLNEDDLGVCKELEEEFPTVKIISDFDTPMEAKGVISQMDVFIGARMHATIAAFSTGVAVIPFSYSRKFEGLYEDLGYPYLISATKMKTEEALDKTIEWIKDSYLLKEEVDKAQRVILERRRNYTETLKKIIENEKKT